MRLNKTLKAQLKAQKRMLRLRMLLARKGIVLQS